MDKDVISQSIRTLFTQGATQVTIEQSVEAFLQFELSGKSPATIKWYENRLKPMVEALGPGRNLAELMEVDLLEWYVGLEKRDRRYVGSVSRPEVSGGLSPYTKHTFVRAAKRFFKWLHRKDILAVNLAADLQLPKLPKRARKGVDDRIAREFVEAARGNVRDYALIRFIETAGIRRGGAAHLLLSDLNIDATDERLRRRATVREKGDKERVVVMSPGALEALEAWLKVRPAINDEHVFLGQKQGETWKPLTETGISAIYRRYKERLGISGPVSPHQWRHRWCRRLIQSGMTLGGVSQLAGHNDVRVTDEFYGGFEIDELQKSYDQHYQDDSDPKS